MELSLGIAFFDEHFRVPNVCGERLEYLGGTKVDHEPVGVKFPHFCVFCRTGVVSSAVLRCFPTSTQRMQRQGNGYHSLWHKVPP
jgi:hypothetical protein